MLLLGAAMAPGAAAAWALEARVVEIKWAAAFTGSLWLAVQWRWVAVRGQSLGKMWCKIAIVRDDGAPAGFVRAVLVRTWLVALVCYIPMFGAATFFADPLAIFRRDRRCLHDRVAGTMVVTGP